MRELRYIYLLLLAFVPVAVYSQSDRQHIRNGNKAYRNNTFSKAETEYRKSIAKNSDNAIAQYNLGCAMMQQGNDSVAIAQFEKAAKMEKNSLNRAMAYHNMGYVLQKRQNYSDAIKAYQNALRNNPDDADSRYNLVMCQKLLKKQQQQQQQKQQQQKQQDKNSKNKDKNKDKKENNKNRKPDQNKMDRQNAEQLLNAVMQKEKNTQDKLQRVQRQPSRKNLNKNW
ncbi:MAG: tetratricopeptide repeat protein [Prevotella sp.]|nr:tetratricopeptide repeat protein [Prevotella sp.]